MKFKDKEMLRVIMSVLFAVMLVSCGSESENKEGNSKEKEQQENNDLGQLNYLEGSWIDSTSGFYNENNYLLEEWTVYQDSLSGRGYKIKNGDTTLTERLRICIVNDKLTYIASPIGQSLISFTSVHSEKGGFKFQNKINDFPHTIIYYPPSDNEMQVDLIGLSSGFERTVSYEMKKTR